MLWDRTLSMSLCLSRVPLAESDGIFVFSLALVVVIVVGDGVIDVIVVKCRYYFCC